MAAKEVIPLTEEQQKFLQENMGLAGWAVKRLQRLYNWAKNVEYEDLLQSCFMGLCRAVKGYNPEKFPDINFSTYAWPCMRSAAQNFAITQHVIKMPHGYLAGVAKTEKQRRLNEAWQKIKIIPLEPLHRKEHGEGYMSIYDESLLTWDGKEDDVDPFLLRELQKIFEDLKQNRPKWHTIITGRIQGKTLTELGRELCLTKERVRQIEINIKKHIKKRIEGPKVC